MKIAIHKRSGSFSDQWITYCEREQINYKIVDCFDNDIISQLKDCDAVLWHHHHGDFKDVLVAKSILFALEHAGFKVYPNFKTGWHFDDKVAQKYLLEAINAPMVPSYVFYDKDDALNWAKNTTYPKVFKLKGGAGASNVSLVKSYSAARKKINRAFGKGFSQFNRIENFKERIRRYKSGQSSFFNVIKGIGRLLIPTQFSKNQSREKGYAYFQKFIPNNDYDIRIVVVNDIAAGERRFVRENDFRASGSGKFSYDGIDKEVVKVAFEVAERLKLQSVAFDFVYDENNQPLIIEMSYGFGTKGILNAPGYRTRDLTWHADKFEPHKKMIEDIMENFKETN